MSKSKKHEKPGKREGGEAGPPSRPNQFSRALDRLSRALEWPGATGWVGTAFALAALWFAVSAFALRAKRSRMEADSPDARAAAEESRSWGFGDRFLLPVLLPNEAGVVVRENAKPGARTFAVVLGTGGGVSTLTRSVPGDRATRMRAGLTPGQPPPRWVRLARLARRGGVIEAAASADGVNWFPARGRPTGMPSKALVGLVVRPATSDPCVASFRSLRVMPEPAGEWRDAGEAGAVPPPASVVSGTSATVASGGAGDAATGEASHMIYLEMEGDFEITALVGEIEPAYGLPEPLAGGGLLRARLAVAADARASGVFGFFAALLAALLWGLRRFDPSVRAEIAERTGGHRS